MKSKISLRVTSIVQAAYLLCILLNFLCIWMFTVGVPYTYPFAIIGSIVLTCLPVEILCFVVNLSFIIMDNKHCTDRAKLVKRCVIMVAFLILLIAIKLGLHFYSDVLVGVV